MGVLLTALAVLVSVSLGYYVFKEFGTGGADATYDAIALVSSTLWILAGIFLIVGGHVLIGSVLIVIFSYIAFSKGRTTERRARSWIAG